MLTAIMIILALIIYLAFYFTHGKYLEKKVFKANPSAETPARKFYDGVDYVPANKYVLYGHHFASIAGAGPIVGPTLALGWGWLPSLLWVWFGNVFIGVVHDYLALAASVRYDGRSIAWVAGNLMGRAARVAFNLYIWFALLLVVAAFGFVISVLFNAIPGAGAAAIFLIFLAMVIGFLAYKTRMGFRGATILAIAFVILSVLGGLWCQYAGLFKLSFEAWLVILTIYTIVAASLPVWLLLQPRDYMNAYILWASLAIGGAALIALGFKGVPVTLPAYTMWNANVVGGVPSPFWPTVPLVIACGALSGFHSLVSSGTTAKQLANEIDALLIGYGGMLTEGFLATMVIASISAMAFQTFVYPTIITKALVNTKAMKIVGVALNYKPLANVVKISISGSTAVIAYKTANGVATTTLSVSQLKSYYLQFLNTIKSNPVLFGKYYTAFVNALKWTVIPWSYALAIQTAFGWTPLPWAIFAAMWITGFALTSLDTAARLGRFAWQELFMPIKDKMPSLYKAIANRWVASIILVVIGMALAYSKAFLVIWPAFSGMNQLLASLALMTISLWVIKVQKAPGLGKALTVAPAIFLWVTVTIALIWYLAFVVPHIALAKPFVAAVVGTATGIGLGLNLFLFAGWVRGLKRPIEQPQQA